MSLRSRKLPLLGSEDEFFYHRGYSVRLLGAKTEIPAEGVIWLTFHHDAPLLKQTMTYLYSGFSHVLWPMYVPFAVGVLEAVRWRKKAMFAFEAAGIAVGLYLLYFIVTRPVIAEVVGKHIVYASPHFYLVPVMVFYLAATCVSCFFSSHGFVKLFGVLAFLSFVAAYVVHAMAFFSIWCFFAAILSLLIYLHLRFRDLGGFPNEAALPPAIARPAP